MFLLSILPELWSDPLSYRCRFLLPFFLSAEILELINLNFAFWKERLNYQLSAHGADKVLQRADVHIRAALSSTPQPDSRRESWPDAAASFPALPGVHPAPSQPGTFSPARGHAPLMPETSCPADS